MVRIFDKIIGWSALGFLAADVIAYYYPAYGPDIAKAIDHLHLNTIKVKMCLWL
jgi:hypothetical protein